MTRRLFEIALADEVVAELARQRRSRVDLARAVGMAERTLHRRLHDGHLSSSELDAIAADLGIDVGTLHERAHAALDAAARVGA